MSKYLFLGIAAIASAIATSAKAYAESAEDPSAGDGEPAKPRRGRPPGGTPAGEPAGGGATGPTDAERLESNKALIKPLVESGNGEEVKKVIAKYSKTGLKDITAADQKAFETDIAALSY